LPDWPGAQKPFWQTSPLLQSSAWAHGRVQYPLMHASRPHCELVLQALAPCGITRQLLPRQYSPMWQSALPAQAASQTPCTQLKPVSQSLLALQVGKASQVPLWHPHVL
jgi:hypothetical protein